MKLSRSNHEILDIALPAIISNITTPLLGLVDTAITGHLGAAVYMGAIAVGGTMFSMVYWVMNFLRLGTSGVTAQAYGAGDHATAVGILRRGMYTALCIAAIMILLAGPLCGLLLKVVDADAETSALSAVYFRIVIFGAPAVLATYVLTGWMLGMQNSRVPMYMALVTNVVNIIVSLVLVILLGMKIEGVAIGTVVAQYAGAITGWIFLFKVGRLPACDVKEGRLPACEMHQESSKNSKDSVSQAGSLPSLKNFKNFINYLRLNIEIMLRTACLAAVTVWFTRIGASMGAVTLAANALLMQFFIIFSYFMDGFAFAGEALAGKHLGASDHAALRLTVRNLLRWGVGVVALFMVIYAVGGRWIVDILTDDYGVRECASQYLLWILAVPAAGVLAFVWDGVFIGLVWMRSMLVTMVIAMLVFFFTYPTLTAHFGNHGLWLSFILYLTTRGLVQSLIWWTRKSKLTH